MAGHKFDPDKSKQLDSFLRKFFMPVNKIIKDIKPSKNETWADIGAGTGVFTIPIAAKVKEVYAMDISETMLQKLQQHLTSKNINNVKLLKSDESKIPLNDSSVENVFLAFVAHELNDPANYFKETRRILKPGGRLLIIDFAKVISFGPPLDHRLEAKQVDKWAKEACFKKGKNWKWSRSVIGWEFFTN
jgi:ubiquinone/menaquinone biosynthesis C-methylase UbiE